MHNTCFLPILLNPKKTFYIYFRFLCETLYKISHTQSQTFVNAIQYFMSSRGTSGAAHPFKNIETLELGNDISLL